MFRRRPVAVGDVSWRGNGSDDAGDDARNISAPAERVRRHRARRQNGLRCFTIELRVTEIDRLVAFGYLKADDRDDPEKVLCDVAKAQTVSDNVSRLNIGGSQSG
jgi:hypothetical protein